MTATLTTNTSVKLMPGTQVPSLEVETLNGEIWKLADQTPTNFTMVVFYRGLHCPICKNYLLDLDRKIDNFRNLGVEVIAISSDSKDRAQNSKKDWELPGLTIGYGIRVELMRNWGLYVSQSAFEKEPAFFNEPGLFFIKPDGILFYIGINNAPFGRPSFSEMLSGIDFVVSKNYPTRGTA